MGRTRGLQYGVAVSVRVATVRRINFFYYITNLRNRGTPLEIMIIRWTRGKDNKPPTLTCLRDDGSVTCQKSSEFFVLHDFLHYAVESTLGFRDAFYGMVAQGRNLDSFGTQNDIKDTYPANALRAEEIVGAIQYSLAETELPSDDELATTLLLTPAQARAIRAYFNDLRQRWDVLPRGESPDVDF